MIDKDVKDVQSIVSGITERFGNPCEFDTYKESGLPEPLKNIATGVVETCWNKRYWKAVLNRISWYKNWFGFY